MQHFAPMVSEQKECLYQIRYGALICETLAGEETTSLQTVTSVERFKTFA